MAQVELPNERLRWPRYSRALAEALLGPQEREQRSAEDLSFKPFNARKGEFGSGRKADAFFRAAAGHDRRSLGLALPHDIVLRRAYIFSDCCGAGADRNPGTRNVSKD